MQSVNEIIFLSLRRIQRTLLRAEKRVVRAHELHILVHVVICLRCVMDRAHTALAGEKYN